MKYKILGKWTFVSSYHKTYYYLFLNKNGIKVCVSKAIHSNGEITYAMSDERNELKLYGTQAEIKAIINELEKGEK